MGALLLVLLLPVIALAQGPQIGRDLFYLFQQVKWHSTAVPAPGVAGFLAGPPTDWPDADRLACFRYRSFTTASERSDDYYALDVDEPACRLLRARVSTAESTPEAATAAYYAAQTALDRQYGPSRDPGKVQGWGSAAWRDVRQWDSNGLRILLLVRDPFQGTPGQPRIEIIAEHQTVLRAREEDVALRGHSRLVQRDLAGEMERAVVAEVGDALPKLAEILAGAADAATLRASIQILVNLAAQASGERRAALLFAADRVAARLGPKMDPKMGNHGERRIEMGLRFDADHYGGWLYKHDLLERVWREQPDTRWGESAFVLLQEAGWQFGMSCPADPVYFPQVIENGERFLAEHTASPYRLETAFQLAQAYEDWWNAAQPVQDHFAIDAARYAPRKNEMRAKAIAAYEQVLAAEPTGPRGRWAALRLPRLKLGLRTDWFLFRFVDSCH